MGRPRRTSTSTARPNRFGRKPMFSVLWYQRGVVCYELLKPGKMVNTKRYQQQLTDLNHSLLEKRPERGRTERGNMKSFFFMTMLHNIWQIWFATRWKHLTEKFYTMRLTHRTLLLSIITCLHRWATH